MIWTALLVLGLGVVVALVCLQPPTPQDALFVSRAYARTHHKMHERHPASPQTSQPQNLTTGFADPPSQRPRALAITLDCDGQAPKRFDHSISLMRLSGKICQTNQEILSSEIRNSANNTSATVFNPSVSSYTTDYFALAPGENRIRILHILKDGGREEREVLIERATAASTK